MIPEWDCATIYSTGHIVWFGELQYIMTANVSINDMPDDSYRWRVRWTKGERK